MRKNDEDVLEIPENSLPKEFWLSNDSSKACHSCEKQFSAIRRKHHCRYCGLIFCNKCIKLNQKLKPESKIQKICEECLSLIKNSNQEPRLKVQNGPFLNSFMSDIEDSFEIDENILDFAQELSPSKVPSIEQCTLNFLQIRAVDLLKKYEIHTNSHEIIVPIVTEVVETVCPSCKIRNDNMDITKYVKFVKVYAETLNCEFFQGTVLLKNIAKKKMPKTLDWPKILFLDYALESGGITTMNMLINEENEINHLFIKKIKSVGPNIIICTSILSESILSELAEMNMVVVMNVSLKDFNHLARITRGHPLKSINQACNIEKILGKCRKMEYYVDKSQAFIFFTEIKDYTLGGAMIIKGENPKKIKKIVKELIIDCRNVKLERIFLLECWAKWSDSLFLNLFASVTELKFISASKNNICQRNSLKKIEFYKENDVCLGEFITNLIRDTEKPCEKCGNLIKDHMFYYIKNEKVIKVSMFKVKAINDQDLFLSINCYQCHKSMAPHYLSNAAWEYSFHKFLNNFFCKNSGVTNCGHEIFRQSFKFQLGTLQILFQSDDFFQFSLVFPGKFTFCENFFSELTQETLKEAQISSKCVLDNILNQGKGLVIKINQEMSSVDSTYDQLLELRSSLLGIIEKIYATMREVFEPDVSIFKDYLQVELLRRRLFLECCRYKQFITFVDVSIRKIKPQKKGSHINCTTSLIDITYIDPELLMDEDIMLYFYKLQHGNLTLPPCNSKFVPIEENDCGAVIAYSLSSLQYHHEVLAKAEKNLEVTLLDPKDSEWSFQAYTYDNIEVKHSETMRKLYGDNLCINATAFYPFQFNALRKIFGIEHDDFVLSISKTIFKSEDFGKSGAIFKKSHDNMYILKIIDEREFKMFNGIALNYFKHICKGKFHNIPSILNICVGAFKVQVKNFSSGKNKSEYFLVFENIGRDLKGPTACYDLKGTTNKRRKVKDGDKKTKMDLNFVEDFSSLPLPIGAEDKKYLEACIINDTLFLSRQNVIDYSIFIVISFTEMKIAMGIIDYMQQYTLDKVIENKYKIVIGNHMPTIIHPDQYKDRFRDQILNCYFIDTD